MTEKLWGARFARDLTPDVLEYTLTVDIDERLILFDLWQDIAHILMLGRQGIIPAPAARAILGSLLALYESAGRGDLTLRPEYEDVHLNIEQMVIQDLGVEVGGHMHTARSRNDQVSTDTRMYLRQVQLDAIVANLGLIEELTRIPDEEYLTILPGYTHSQAAQPVTAAFWKTAHASMLMRDVQRLRDSYGRTNESPLGACALAGTSFPLDRTLTARLLGFDRVLTHALDATSARDYLIEVAAAFAIGGNTLSRMAEEIVMWSGHEYNLCEVADEFTTGSSIMPQKKNPVVAELVRARTGRTVGVLVQLLTAVKGVPLGYSCDLQEDKPFLWNSIDAYLSTLHIVQAQTQGLRFNGARGEDLCWDNFSTATELANYLVTELATPFRQAHRVAGSLVAVLLERRLTLRDVSQASEILSELGYQMDAAALARLLAPKTAVTSYTSVGGTSPTSVQQMRDELATEAAAQRVWAQDSSQGLRAANEVTLRAAREATHGVDIEMVLDTEFALPGRDSPSPADTGSQEKL